MHRGRIEVLGDILELLQENSLNKTQIMYKANLSFTMLREYLIVLMTRDLVMELEKKQKYTNSKSLNAGVNS